MAATKFKMYITENKISLKEISIDTKIPVETLSRIATGKRAPRVTTATKIAKALGVHPTKLFDNLHSYARIKKYRSG